VGFTASELIAAAAIPDREARRLLLAAAGQTPTWLIGDPVVSPEIRARFDAALRRRRTGEPIQYIEGTCQFGPIEVRIDSRALIPRPETEYRYELALVRLARVEAPTVVDLCTGSGVLALALKHDVPDASVTATDISSQALALARENAEMLGLEIDFREGDLFAAVPARLRGAVDLIVANPPYVSTGEIATLPREVADFEPTDALVAGEDGLAVVRRIAAEAMEWLGSGGRLICEIGETQGDECLSLFAQYQPDVAADLTGRPRYVVGRRFTESKTALF